MNKQQLAAAIWNSANSMRSKIEASEYKDLILGFIFYKFLSDKEVTYLKKESWTGEDIKTDLNEDNLKDRESIQDNLGYFIAYKDLYDTWIAAGSDFNYGNITEAISRFNRNIADGKQRVFGDIFNSLSTALPKLGETDTKRRAAARDLLLIINPIPTDGKQGYDVLGYVYEYLLQQFAANAGSKAGEFYTPHQVATLKAEIIADHLAGRPDIDVFDGTAGSSSLLLNVGAAIARRNGNADSIRYFAQEYKEATYNLTRMNLIMHDTNIDNIVSRRGDTLDTQDWPLFSEDDPTGTYSLKLADVVVENPPYSQKWDNRNRENDPRFKEYGVAPKSKADFAFLLQGLYHLKSDGIMTIILPHGVLFRGGEEEKIRTQLIEKGNIDTVIGLPANIFFGTGIPTIVMILKKNRPTNDILFIDASQGFIKQGKKNELRNCDVRRAFDAYKNREEVPGYAHLATLEEIRSNEYNLNIPRYIAPLSNDDTHDIYASMFGGIPSAEVAELDAYWQAFPGLKEAVFEGDGAYLSIKADSVAECIRAHPSIESYRALFTRALKGFDDKLYQDLIANLDTANSASVPEAINGDLFARCTPVPLIDPYDAYQALSDEWAAIEGDIEILQTEGFEAIRVLDPNMIVKKVNDRDTEVQDKKQPWTGHIVPFQLVQETLLKEQYSSLKDKEAELFSIGERIAELDESIPAEDRGNCGAKEESGFNWQELSPAIASLLALEDDRISDLNDYLEFFKGKPSKEDKLAFMQRYPATSWEHIAKQANGTMTKKAVEAQIERLAANITIEPESLLAIATEANELHSREGILKKEIKALSNELDEATQNAIQNLTDEQARELLRLKWIVPITTALNIMPENAIDQLVARVEDLKSKYTETLSDIDVQIHEAETELSSMLAQLVGNDYDMAGLNELSKLLGNE